MEAMHRGMLRNGWLQRTVLLILVIGPLFGVVTAIGLLWNRSVFWSDIALLFSLLLLTSLGVTIGYHRMLTHDGFRAPALVRTFLLILGCMAFEGPPSQWAATHIHHHASSDEEGDPHSPLDGFWHAHMGWLLRPAYEDPRVFAPHLLRDPVVRFVDRFTLLWMGLSLLFPYLLGGWTGFVWGGLVRVFLTTHITWSVNSVCHTFGGRDFATADESRNNWIVGLLAFGEGWHNNHHAFPRNAFHGMRWWQADLSGSLIRLLERWGVIWNVQRVTHEAQALQRIRAAKTASTMQTLRAHITQSVDSAEAEMQRIFETTIVAVDHEHLKASLDQCAERLQEIRAAVRSPAHFRRPTLESYARQVQELVAQVRRMAPEAEAA
jgi:stearoyl-CoA desaturase (Delta-9 desaturase)